MTYPRNPFCDMPHPDYLEPQTITDADGATEIVDAPTVWCRRMTGHPGKHSAFTFLVSRPETWSTNNQGETRE